MAIIVADGMSHRNGKCWWKHHYFFKCLLTIVTKFCRPFIRLAPVSPDLSNEISRKLSIKETRINTRSLAEKSSLEPLHHPHYLPKNPIVLLEFAYYSSVLSMILLLPVMLSEVIIGVVCFRFNEFVTFFFFLFTLFSELMKVERSISTCWKSMPAKCALWHSLRKKLIFDQKYALSASYVPTQNFYKDILCRKIYFMISMRQTNNCKLLAQINFEVNRAHAWQSVYEDLKMLCT